MTVPLRCVIDTNVTTTANRANGGASEACVVSSAKALQAVMANGHVFIDAGGHIVAEYRKHLSPKGQPGPGDAFFKWLLTHEWSSKRVTRVVITPTPEDEEDFVDLPAPPRGTVYDRSDRKFLAVAAAHPDRPPICSRSTASGGDGRRRSRRSAYAFTSSASTRSLESTPRKCGHDRAFSISTHAPSRLARRWPTAR